MAIDLISTIHPKNDGSFATHDSQYGLGGWHEALTITERDAIPEQRRREGMAVFVKETKTVYSLGEDLVTWTVLTQVDPQVVYSISVPGTPSPNAAVFFQEFYAQLRFVSGTATVRDAPTADLTFSVVANSMPVGQITFSSSGVPTVNIQEFDIMPGQVLEINAPADLLSASVFSFVLTFQPF